MTTDKGIDESSVGIQTQEGGDARPSICIVSHNAYGAVRGGGSGHIGGVERQTSLLAKWLAQRGYQVSLLTWHEGGDPVEFIDGVRVIKIAQRQSGIRGFRFFHPRWTGLIKAMRQANSDIYYHNCAECVTGQIALWCKSHGKAFVFYTANDPDCDPALPELKNPRDKFLYRYGLRSAAVRIVQTKLQRALLKEGFGLDSIVLPMPCPAPTGGELSPRTAAPSRRVLWIARVCKQKRPDRLLDLAKACPELEFDLVGPFYSDSYAKDVYERTKQTTNVTVHGAASRDRVASFYANAACLCCTSDYEGFPNTFLEAWSHGLPIVSTFDPDSIIRDKDLGIVAKDVPQMQKAISLLLSSPGRYREISANALDYFTANHRAESVFLKFEQIFSSLFCDGRLRDHPTVAIS